MKRGFTLIELLAVIVIIAIISLIAFPTITGIVDRTKKEAFQESVNNLISAGENYIIKYSADHQGEGLTYPVTFICNGESCINSNNDKLPFKGKVPSEGNLIIRGEKDIYAEYISDGKYCVAGTKGNLQIYNNCDDIDVTAPTVSVEADFWDLTININDTKSGAGDYCLTLTKDSSTCEWISNSEAEVSHHVDLEEAKTYYVFAKDKKGNISNPVETLVKPKILYKEEILNGSWPVLKGNLIPITIEPNGKVHKADVYKEWYKYENKTWANAVILIDKTKTYEDNQVIPESNIESYFVWIPKYSYKLFDMGNYTSNMSSDNKAHTIDIQFGITNTTDTSTTCATPMASGASGNCAVNKYMTHPSFISFNVNGFWVGKFETGDGNRTQDQTYDNGTNTALKVKPNLGTIYYNSMNRFFTQPYNYNRTLDSHLMKNTEWGAVAYLSYSRYGINAELRHNDRYQTGCAASTPTSWNNNQSDCNPYNSEIGYLASTTGNISGIYDMSGGVDEIVAQYYASHGNSFGNDVINAYAAKYFDAYSGDFSLANRILGDATGEMGPMDGSNQLAWNKDIAGFSTGWGRSLSRGYYANSNYGTMQRCGIFALQDARHAERGRGFRIVLSPQ
ncbi:MAG: prepilin-type N-terminal cleavage/methylation domain-containing protein [Bacilli bacterium]|nr:prepilin-type N-terminal cleavage/methylation domain-containing protein [Bacilli bacterium]